MGYVLSSNAIHTLIAMYNIPSNYIPLEIITSDNREFLWIDKSRIFNTRKKQHILTFNQ